MLLVVETSLCKFLSFLRVEYVLADSMMIVKMIAQQEDESHSIVDQPKVAQTALKRLYKRRRSMMTSKSESWVFLVVYAESQMGRNWSFQSAGSEVNIVS